MKEEKQQEVNSCRECAKEKTCKTMFNWFGCEPEPKREIKTNTVYKHFKGNYYLVSHIATHSETRELYVVYKALYGNYSYYIRPYEMFASEVDHDKYPDVKQKYRFEEYCKMEDYNVQSC